MKQIEDKLFGLIEAKTGTRPRLDDTMDVMKIDSLAMAELTVEIEKAFDIHIDDEVLDVDDAQGLVEYIKRKSAERTDKL